jgi:glycosyltransferase involved in cell wall biosynthesis
MQAHVKLVGPVRNDQLNTWYNAADVSCLASSSEGWPNVLLESMACGTPVVVTNLPGMTDIVTSPKLGFLVERTVPALAKGLADALTYDWDRTVLVRHASSRSWDCVAAEFEEFLARRLGTIRSGSSRAQDARAQP